MAAGLKRFETKGFRQKSIFQKLDNLRRYEKKERTHRIYEECYVEKQNCRCKEDEERKENVDSVSERCA